MSTLASLLVKLGVDAGGVQKGADQAESVMSRLSGRMGAIAGAAGAAAGGLLGAGLLKSLDIEQGTDKLAAQVGATGPMSARLGEVAGKLYAGAYGESMGDVQAAVKSVVQNIDGMRQASAKSLQDTTAQAMTLAQVMDADVGGVTAAVSQMLRTGLAKNAEQAMDVLTVGAQHGADKAGDLLDTFVEYPTQFRKLGLSGQTAMGLMSQGLAKGARDSDIVADALKEFSIRAVDGSKTTAQGFKALGLSADDMAAKIGKGGPTAAAALDLTLDRLRAIKDPVKQSQAAVALFGTQAEDLGAALFALDPSTAVQGLGKLKGATDAAGQTMADNGATRIETMKRRLDGLLVSLASAPGPLGTAGASVAAFGGTALGMAGDLGQFVSGFGGVVAKVAGGAVSMAASAASGTASAVASIAVQGAKYAWLAVQALLSAGKVALSWLIAIGPIALVIAAVVGLVVLIVRNWDTIRSATSKAWHAVSSFVTGAARGVLNWLRGNWPVILAVLTGPVGLAVLAIARNWDKIKGGAKAAWNTVIGFLRGIPGRIKAAVGNLGNLLFGAGRNVVQSLINGIKSMVGAVGGAIGSVASKIRDFLPFSPARTGPLSGRGSPQLAGERIAGMLATGMLAGDTLVERAADRLAGAASPTGTPAAGMGGYQVPGLARAAAAAGAPVVLEFRSGGSRLEDLLLELFRKAVRSRGGDVQVVLGGSRR